VHTLDDALDLACPRNKRGDERRQVVATCIADSDRPRGLVAAYGPRRISKLGTLIGRKVESELQAVGRIAVRMSGAPFELLDAVHAQTGSLGELMLRQAGHLPMVTQQIAKSWRRIHRGQRLAVGC
jgi:hypothetical protein